MNDTVASYVWLCFLSTQFCSRVFFMSCACMRMSPPGETITIYCTRRFDRSNSGISSSDVVSTLHDLGIPIDNVDEIFGNTLLRATNDPDASLLDFATFLKIMGLKGSNHDYLHVELEDYRRRLLEALNTFHTFDEDGGGTIDALEIKVTMRAMGQKVCKG